MRLFETKAGKVLRAPVSESVFRVQDDKYVVIIGAWSSFTAAPDEQPTTWSDTIQRWWYLVERVTRFYKDMREAR